MKSSLRVFKIYVSYYISNTTSYDLKETAHFRIGHSTGQ